MEGLSSLLEPRTARTVLMLVVPSPAAQPRISLQSSQSSQSQTLNPGYPDILTVLDARHRKPLPHILLLAPVPGQLLLGLLFWFRGFGGLGV